MTVPIILIGVALLILGRKLYWLFVGTAGCVGGIMLATRLLGGQPDWVILAIALAGGVLGALLAVFLQQMAVALAGFIGGGYVALNLMDAMGGQPGPLAWIPLVVGGIVGLVLVLTLFDWSLILLSSLLGANLIVQAPSLRSSITALLFTLLVVVGIAVQATSMHRERSNPTPRTEE
jgi:hypothetical protein